MAQILSFEGDWVYFLWEDEQRINKRKKRLGRRARFLCREDKVSLGSFSVCLHAQWHPGKRPAGENPQGVLSKSKLQQMPSC